jgi:hypothetical protein
MAEAEFPNQIRDAARTEWHRYIDSFAPFRPALQVLQTAHERFL